MSETIATPRRAGGSRLNPGEYRCDIKAEITIAVECRSNAGIWESRNVKFSLAETLPSSDYVPDSMDRLKTIVTEGVVRTVEQHDDLAALIEEDVQ